MKHSRIAEYISTWDKKTLIILDIDSTLVLTHPRNQAILRRFAEQHHKDFPEETDKLRQVECKPFEYGYEAALERVELASASRGFSEALAQYWRAHFFTGEYLHLDEVHKGALEFVIYLHRQEIPFIYLTARYKTTMWQGTLETLKAKGFPIDAEQLFLKPQPEDKDELFKSTLIGEIKQQYNRTILIDNEPKVLNRIHQDHPGVDLIFVDTCHSPNVSPPPTPYSIKDFSELQSS